MTVLVAYVSRSGRTAQVAEAILGEIGSDKEIRPLAEVTDLAGYDLAFIGFPIERFGPPEAAIAFLQTHSAGRTLALFATHASHEEGEMVRGWLGKAKDAAAGARVAGVFSCQGQLAEGVKNFMLNSGDPRLRAWAEQDNSQGQPDAARLERARAFAREVMSQASV